MKITVDTENKIFTIEEGGNAHEVFNFMSAIATDLEDWTIVIPTFNYTPWVYTMPQVCTNCPYGNCTNCPNKVTVTYNTPDGIMCNCAVSNCEHKNIKDDK